MKLDNRSYIRITPSDKRPSRRDLSFPELLGVVHKVPQYNVKRMFEDRKAYRERVEREIKGE